MLNIRQYEVASMLEMGIPFDPTELEVSRYDPASSGSYAGAHVDHFTFVGDVLPALIIGGLMAGGTIAAGMLTADAADKSSSAQSELGKYQAQQQAKIAELQAQAAAESAEQLNQVAQMVMAYPLASASVTSGFYLPEMALSQAYLSAFPILTYTSVSKPQYGELIDEALTSLEIAKEAVDGFVFDEYEQLGLEDTVTKFYEKNQATMRNYYGIQLEEGEKAIRAAVGGSHDARPWAVKAAMDDAGTNLQRAYIQGLLGVNDKRMQAVMGARQQEFQNELATEEMNNQRLQIELSRLGAAYSYASNLMGLEADNWRTEMSMAIQSVGLYMEAAQQERALQWHSALQDQELDLKQLVAAAGLMEGATTVELNGILTAAQTRSDAIVAQAQYQAQAIQTQLEGTLAFTNSIASGMGAMGGSVLSAWNTSQITGALKTGSNVTSTGSQLLSQLYSSPGFTQSFTLAPKSW